MKFTHQLKFNSVPEWKEHYIHYNVLKKIVYAIAKAEADEVKANDEEHIEPLLAHEKVSRFLLHSAPSTP